MAGMDHGGYWYGYLAARHDTCLGIALICIGAALLSSFTGKTLVRFQGIVSRAQDPKGFWQAVVGIYVIGAIFLGLFLFGPS
jgi:hypothetical protein